MSDKKSRPYGIVVWGATGFTGNVICEYLLNTNHDVKWAIGGRNKSKLESLKHELTSVSPKAKDLDILVGDIEDQTSIDAITKQTRVLLTCAGPYTVYGTPIVASCVRNGTDYCDITGEYTWIRKLIAAYDADAKRTGAMIVNCCGMDCIPSDLGCFFVTSHVKKTYGVNCESVRSFVTNMKGGISGGTIATVLTLVGDGSMKGAGDPYYLVPNDPSKVRQPRDLMIPEHNKELNLWQFAHPLAVTDNRLVRRSQYLMGYPNGEFSFRVAAASPSLIKAIIATIVISTMFILLKFSFARSIIGKVFPPGSGPKKANLKRGGAEVVTLAKLEPKSGVPKFVKGRVSFRGDPGYYVTAHMVAESALCLATQRDILPARQGGIHTPASSMGMLLVERLRKNAGVQFEIDESFSA